MGRKEVWHQWTLNQVFYCSHIFNAVVHVQGGGESLAVMFYDLRPEDLQCHWFHGDSFHLQQLL